MKKQILKFEETGNEPLNIERILRKLWDSHDRNNEPARNEAEAKYRGIEFSQQVLDKWYEQKRKQ